MLQKKKKKQEGVALIYTLLLTSVILVILSVTTKLTLDSMNSSKYELVGKTQVINIAQAGLQDAFFWFSRKDIIVKKITGIDPFSDHAFNPKPRDPTIPNDKGETDDDSIGIVRDLVIDPVNKLYGHYEVKKQVADNENGSTPAPDDPEAVHDVSHKRYSVDRGSGSVWKIVSKGYVYRRDDEKKTLNGITFDDKCCDIPGSKNFVFARRTITAELQRLSLEVQPAAINLVSGNFSTNTFSSISSGSGTGVKGIRSAPAGGNFTALTAPVLNGGYDTSDTSFASKLTCGSVFGVDRTTLKAIADVPLDVNLNTNGKKYLSSLIFIDNNASFSPTNKLRGSGILFVKGNLTFADNGGSFFSGLIYIENGTLTIGTGNTLSGSVILANPAGSSVAMTGSGDSATIEYNRGVLDDVRKNLANYRLNRLSFTVLK